MAFHIRDAETDRLVRKSAARKGIGLTQAVKEAVLAEEERELRAQEEFLEKVRALQTSANGHVSGSKEDKAFFDELWGYVDEDG